MNFEILLLLLAAIITSRSLIQGNAEHTYVKGQNASIPCPQLRGTYKFIRLMFSPPSKSSQNVLTIDFRKMNTIQSATEKYKRRVKFDTKNNKKYFILLNLQPEDEGIYECRVRPQRGSVLNKLSNLTVVEPPTSVVVTDTKGREASGLAGPYNEKTLLELTCEAIGGRPTPNITWLRNGKDVTEDTGKGKSVLKIGPLRKEDEEYSYLCEASNHWLAIKQSKPINLDINTFPTKLNFITDDKPLKAGTTYEIECLVEGSKPPAKFTWKLDNKPLENYSEYGMDENNSRRTSTLRFTPKIADEGKTLSCFAENKAFKQKPLQTSMILSIHYAPNVTLLFYPNNTVNEGDYVRLDCDVKSNPPPFEVYYYKKHEKLSLGNKYFTKSNNNSLFTKNTTRKHAGSYSCMAKNRVDEGYSETKTLLVNRGPQCKNRYNVVGASRNETVNVKCAVDSWPAVTRFDWHFNRSGVVEFIHRNYNMDDFTSVMTYTPRNDEDFGNLLCYAVNEYGEIKNPCIYSIVKAELPDRLENCTQVNRTTEMLFVTCISGRDGGLPQTFVAELLDTNQEIHVLNASFSEPLFLMENLSPGTIYYVTLYSRNNKGQSEKVTIELTTVSEADWTSLAVPTFTFPIPPVLSVLIGVVGGLVVVALITAGVMHLRAAKDAEKSKQDGTTQAPIQSTDSEKGGADKSGIPNKLKTPNLYVAASRDLPKEHKGQKNDSSDVEYTELKFSKPQKKAKKDKKKQSGKIKKSEENTLYASIDYAETEKSGRTHVDDKSGVVGSNGKTTSNVAVPLKDQVRTKCEAPVVATKEEPPKSILSKKNDGQSSVPPPPKELVATKCDVPIVTSRQEPPCPKSILSKKNDKPAIPTKPSVLKVPTAIMVTKDFQISDDDDLPNKESVPLMQKSLESNL